MAVQNGKASLRVRYLGSGLWEWDFFCGIMIFE